MIFYLKRFGPECGVKNRRGLTRAKISCNLDASEAPSMTFLYFFVEKKNKCCYALQNRCYAFFFAASDRFGSARRESSLLYPPQ